jgi:peptidoglycan/xylan/chitin deacetylase (PgdA/CDA1 family)
VAFTFDDGPDPEQTPRILDVLAGYGACATFFVIGERVNRYPELVRRIVAEGHAIGNHTYSHLRCRELDLGTLRRQIERTDAALEAALGPQFVPLPVFRPPFGEIRMGQALYLSATGRTLAFWNQDTRDYRGASAQEMAALGSQLTGGDVVLLHDRFPATTEALPWLLNAIRAKGLAAVSLGGTVQKQLGPEPIGALCRSPGRSPY